MIHRHKNLHISEHNLRASALHIDYTQATTQLEALGKSGGDESGDDATTALAGMGHGISLKMHPAALPSGAENL